MLLPDGGLVAIDRIYIGDDEIDTLKDLRRIIIWLYALEGASRIMRCLVYIHFISEKIEFIKYGIEKRWFLDPLT